MTHHTPLIPLRIPGSFRNLAEKWYAKIRCLGLRIAAIRNWKLGVTHVTPTCQSLLISFLICHNQIKDTSYLSKQKSLCVSNLSSYHLSAGVATTYLQLAYAKK